MWMGTHYLCIVAWSLVCYYLCTSISSIGSLPVVINHADFTAGSHTLTLAFTLSNGRTGFITITFTVTGESWISMHMHTCACVILCGSIYDIMPNQTLQLLIISLSTVQLQFMGSCNLRAAIYTKYQCACTWDECGHFCPWVYWFPLRGWASAATPPPSFRQWVLWCYSAAITWSLVCHTAAWLNYENNVVLMCWIRGIM